MDCVSVPAVCKKWVWQTGHDPLGLRMQNGPIQPLAAGEVLVRNAAIGLNPVDWKVLGKIDSWRPGHVPGVDGAGVVVATGEGISASWLGQRVAYHQNLHRLGSFAEYTPLAVRALMRVPDALDFATAASFPCPGLTAWQAIEKVPARKGAAFLISGAGGAVGHYVAQLAAERGFSVSAICHERHWHRLNSLGVSRCVAELGTLEDRAFYAVIDSVGPDRAAQLAARLEANGHLVCIQGRVAQWPFPAFEQAVSLHEVALGALHRHGSDEAWARLIAAGERMLDALATGGMEPETQVQRDFSELPEFLDALRHRGFSGKPLVLLPSS
ncbi:zinc-binding dehydrogenase [Propionivibrio limicola]|uniref:zinc-binding dehydrogenase n=1 Tax=Propionivibrio limicola TaxID=167645 RepID=UPI00129211ED|nr:zinc-binding dehydrogenase [Propionivibrio limicola]